MKTIQIIITAVLLLAQPALSQSAYGEIKGLIKDSELEPVFGATIKITQGGVLIGGTTSDADGKYAVKPLNAGIYEVLVMNPGHVTSRKTNVKVDPEKATYVDFKLKVNMLDDVPVESEPYEKPLLDISMYDITSMDAEAYHNSANYGSGVLNMIGSQSSAMVQDEFGEWHMHGSRAGATEYMIDGVRVASLNGLPNQSVENVSMITGGVPAMYGDLTSGVIVVTTKDYFGGMRAKNIYQQEAQQRYELKQRQKKERVDDEKRKKEIEVKQVGGK